VTIRLFEPDDLRALYAIEDACFEPAVRFSRSLMRSLTLDSACRTWLGILDDIRVGFAIVGLRGESDPTAAYIWTIEVLPAFRRRGVARQLLAGVESSATEAGCTSIELHVSERNSEALALYQTAGYVHLAIQPQYYGRREDAFLYRKQLKEA
jgi:ribosomal protein S18 acetylase RimI-like enzyme